MSIVNPAPAGIRCPACGQPSHNIKRYLMITLMVFLYIFVYHRRATYTQCDACMRKTILTNAAINIIPANLLWLVLLLPWYTILFIMSFTAGHSASVVKELRR